MSRGFAQGFFNVDVIIKSMDLNQDRSGTEEVGHG